VKSITPYDPLNRPLLVRLDEALKLLLIIDHEHPQHIIEAQTIVANFSRPGDLVPDRINELLDEEVVGVHWNVLLLCQDLLVASLNEVSLQRYGNLNVNVVLNVIQRQKLNLGMILRNSKRKDSISAFSKLTY